MSEFVLDGSTTLSWFFEDEVTPFGDWILDRLVSDRAVVPAVLWELEVANGMLKGARRRRASRIPAEKFRKLLCSLPIRQAVPGRGLDDIAALAEKHNLSAYDSTYLELSIREALPLATDDSALAEAAKRERVPLLRDEFVPKQRGI